MESVRRCHRWCAVLLALPFTACVAGAPAVADEVLDDRDVPLDLSVDRDASEPVDRTSPSELPVLATGCRRDEDCAKDPGGLFCNTALGRCERCPIGVGCLDAASIGVDAGPEVTTDLGESLDAATIPPPDVRASVDVSPGRDVSVALDAGVTLDAGTVRDVGTVRDTVTVPDAGSVDTRRFDAGRDPYAGRACPAGQARCPVTAFRDEPAAWHRCTPLIAGACPAPDIIIRREWIADDTDEPTPNVMRVTLDRFAPTAPEVTEGCVRSIGWRRLLRFNFAAINIGTGAFHVGRPDENDRVHWQYFTAHGHFHVRGWGDYALRTLAGVDAVRGRKQSFCLEDNIREEGGDPSQRRYAPPLCELFSAEQPYAERAEFGLSPLWGDEYPSDVPCQWLDIGPETPSAGADHVPDGIYNLAVAVNVGDLTPTPLYRESNYANNSASIRIELRGLTVRRCADNAGDACPGGVARRSCEGACP